MFRLKRRWLPEIGLIALGAFFFLRELGTFPAAWSDDSLFMIVAKEIAAGNGYALPLLDHAWHFPHVLLIGPTLLVPTAAAIKLFGFSVAVARIPMALYLAGAGVAFYAWTAAMSDRATARWATLLLITLSAFVNTGKPVLGTVPGFFFLLLGLLCMPRMDRSARWAAAAGCCFGLAILTKLTFALVLPALAIAWLDALRRRDTRSLMMLGVAGCVAALIPIPWKILEFSSDGGFFANLSFINGSESDVDLPLLRDHLDTLLRLPYLTFALMAALGSVGLAAAYRKIARPMWIVTVCLIIFFTAYFLSSFGWYRHLLPAHLLLIPFVVTGVRSTVHRQVAALVLVSFALAQGLWQWDHRGSSASTTAQDAAQYVEEHLQGTNLVIRQAEVFVRLPRRPEWRFLTNPILSKRVPQEMVALSEEERCMHWLRTLEEEERAMLEQEQRIAATIGKYVILRPPADCQ